MNDTAQLVAVGGAGNLNLPNNIVVKRTNIAISQTRLVNANPSIPQPPPPAEAIDIPTAVTAPPIENKPAFLTLNCKNGQVISIPMNTNSLATTPAPMPVVRIPRQIPILQKPSTNTSSSAVVGNAASILTSLLQQPFTSNQTAYIVNGIPRIDQPLRLMSTLPPQSPGIKLPTANLSAMTKTSQPRVFTMPTPNLPSPVIKDKENNMIANGRRVTLQMPILHRPYPAKTITTPCYTNMPRLYPEQLISNPTTRAPVVVNNVINNHNYSKPLPSSPLAISQPPQAGINHHDYSKLPLILTQTTPGFKTYGYPHYFPRNSAPPQIRIMRPPNFAFTPYPTPQPLNINSIDERPQISELKSLLRSAMTTSSHVVMEEPNEDPIGLLVPEVQLVEDDDLKVTIPQWSPRATTIKRCRQKRRNSNSIEKRTENNGLTKKCRVVLKRLNTSVIKNGTVNLSRMRAPRLFAKMKICTASNTVKKRKLTKEENSLVNDDLNDVQEMETKDEPTSLNTMRCLVYKSLGFTHVIPLEDVISIPNEILDNCVPAKKASETVCDQLEKLVNLGGLGELEVSPQFESLDLSNTTSANLDIDLVRKLSQSFNSSTDVNARLKINSLRDKLTTALAMAELQQE